MPGPIARSSRRYAASIVATLKPDRAAPPRAATRRASSPRSSPIARSSRRYAASIVATLKPDRALLAPLRGAHRRHA
ncbi:hypothetical protein [Mycobacterium riyadhense]|nr:hypothetical protein [Mycobacterium riyadhense]